MSITILTFEQWKSENAKFVEEIEESEQEDEDCPECDGDGLHECDCGDQHDCPECGGSGKKSRDPDDILRGIYENQKEIDLLKLSKWGKVVTQNGS